VGDGSSGLGPELDGGGLSLVVSLTLGFSLLLQSVNDVLVSPSDFVGNSLQGAELSSGLQSQDSESGGDDHLLELVLSGGDTLEELESGQGSGTSGRLVGNLQRQSSSVDAAKRHPATATNHSSDSLVKDSGRSSEMEGTGLLGVNDMPLCLPNNTLVNINTLLSLTSKSTDCASRRGT
jgi:hypothetical protein